MNDNAPKDRLMTISGQFATFAASLRYDDLPADIKHLSKLCLLDTLGAGLAGAGADEIVRARRAMIAANGSGQGDALLWGTSERATLPLAALSNAASCHAREIDDFGGCAHSGAVVIPAALGMADRVHATGKELLTSIVVGYEIARRVMDGAGGYYAFKKRGWHSTSTCGVFGAAAASARLLGLDSRSIQLALGFAGSNAGGTWAFIPDGAMNKRIHPGFAAQTGIVSAYLAADGVTSPSGIFEIDWGGYYATYAGDKATPQEAIAGLGSDYRMRLVGFKPYAACRAIHSSIDIALALRKDHVRPDDIADVTVHCSATQFKQLSKVDVQTRLDAQFSLPYGFAVAMLSGGAMLDQYTDEAIKRPEILAFARKVAMVVDASVSDDSEPHLDIKMRNGDLLKRHVAIARGDAANPLNEDELRAKFRTAASAVLNPQQIADLEDRIAQIETLDDAGKIVKHLSPLPPKHSGKANGGIVAPRELANLANHEEAALPPAYRPRVLHLSDKVHPGADLFITSRTVDNLPGPAEPNVAPHTHPVSQTYVFTSETGDFEVDVELSGEHIVTRAPATAFIPAGVEHSLRILRGSGTVLSIVRSGVYE